MKIEKPQLVSKKTKTVIDYVYINQSIVANEGAMAMRVGWVGKERSFSSLDQDLNCQQFLLVDIL